MSEDMKVILENFEKFKSVLVNMPDDKEGNSGDNYESIEDLRRRWRLQRFLIIKENPYPEPPDDLQRASTYADRKKIEKEYGKVRDKHFDSVLKPLLIAAYDKFIMEYGTSDWKTYINMGNKENHLGKVIGGGKIDANWESDLNKLRDLYLQKYKEYTTGEPLYVSTPHGMDEQGPHRYARDAVEKEFIKILSKQIK